MKTIFFASLAIAAIVLISFLRTGSLLSMSDSLASSSASDTGSAEPSRGDGEGYESSLDAGLSSSVRAEADSCLLYTSDAADE